MKERIELLESENNKLTTQFIIESGKLSRAIQTINRVAMLSHAGMQRKIPQSGELTAINGLVNDYFRGRNE